MGAELQTRSYPNWETAKENWRRDQDQAACEDGNSYSGNINMLNGFPSETTKVETVEEAEELFLEHDKFDPPLALELPDGRVCVGGWCSS